MKNSTIKYMTRDAALQNVTRLFENHPFDDVITVEQAYQTWGRDMTKPAHNKSWLSNKLTGWKYHGLVKPIYAMKDNRRVLARIQLTFEGKRMLGRLGEELTLVKLPNGSASASLSPSRSISPSPSPSPSAEPTLFDDERIPTPTPTTTTTTSGKRESFEDVLAAVQRLKEQNPGFEIIFDVKLKPVV